ncbi:MAG: carboxyl-terminal processing protease [Patescibacteria group bacterium]|nr:carboxyl-terminal processing protease [Patescibacteria group bacterium]
MRNLNKKIKQPALIIFSLLIVGGVYLLGFYAGKDKTAYQGSLAYSPEVREMRANNKDNFDFNLYFEVWNSLKSEHVDKNKIKDSDLFYGSLEGMAAATGDPYTIFMNPEETTEFYEDLSGTFEGIGAEIGMRNEIITVIAPLDGTPAQKAGLRAGDKIYAIDGESVLGLSVNEAVKKIRGEKGTAVTLTIIRNDDKPSDIEIIRDKIVVNSVKTEMKENGVYYLQISNFNDDTQILFDKAVSDILLKNPKGIVLDLRNNPGGYLDTAIYIASDWIKEGPIVAEQFGENKRAEHPSRGQARLSGIKTAVLINEGSASASEIVAGALRDYKKATIIGKQSFGKGSVQNVRDLSDGSSLKITVARWLTPEGDYIHDKGIAPQIEVDISEDDINNNRDPQLERAINFILENK